MGNAIAPLRPREPLGPNLRMFLDMIVDANKEIVRRYILTIARDIEAKSKNLPL